jgi:transposase InsO family protein
MLRREDWPVNGKRARRLLAEMGLKRKAPFRRRRMTDSRHDLRRYPNLVVGLEVTRPDHVWVADISYVRLREEFVYQAVVTTCSPAGSGAGSWGAASTRGSLWRR